MAKLPMDFLEANRMIKAPHPPYSPDLAQPNLFLFRDPKKQLSGDFFDNVDHVLTAVYEILDGFHRPMLVNVFEECVGTLRQYMGHQWMI
jgi:hypothetical protein